MPTIASHQMCQIMAKPAMVAKKASDHADRRVARQVDRPATRGSCAAAVAAGLLHAPVGVGALDPAAGPRSSTAAAARRSTIRACGRSRDRRCGRRRAARSRMLTKSCTTVQRDAGQDHQRAGHRHQHQRLPAGLVVVLHAARRAHQAERIERHEGEIEADQPAPERRPCPAARRGVKPNALGNQ